MAHDEQLHELVDALSDRSITDEQIATLNQRLESDQASRHGFMNLMRIEAELGALHHPLASWSFEDGAAFVDSTEPLSTLSSPANLQSQAEPQSPSRRSVRFLQTMGALAASVAITAAASSWLTYEGVQGRGPLAAMLATDSVKGTAVTDVVARVAATRNCRWSGGTTDLGFGADVAGGELLELETGLAELTFPGGARVVLEGPAAFRISDSETVELYRGRVAAAVPTEAQGFSIKTPRLVIAETGAQFGVVAGADGSDEVHVFEGAIEARAVDDRGRITSVVNLASLEAARFRSANHRFARFNADDESFVRSLETRNGPGEGLLAFENFSYPAGPVAWQNGGFGWVGPWADLEAAATGDSLEEAAGAAPSNGVARGSIAAADLVALGNRFVQSGNANRVRRTLSTSLGGVFDAAGLIESVDGLRLIGRNGSTIYISFLQRVSKTNDVFYGFELHRGDGNFNRVLCIGNGAEGNGYGVSTNFHYQRDVKEAAFESLGEENDAVNFVVVRIDFGDDDKDIATVYRNPSSLTEENSCVATAKLSGMFAFDRVSLGNFEGSKLHEIDEVRIGTDFRAVTGRRASGWNNNQEESFALRAPFVWSLPLASLK